MKLVAALMTALSIGGIQPSFRAGIEMVQLDVAVTRSGKPVAGLTAQDFDLTDEGVPQVIQSVAMSDVPLELTVVLDVSQSVSGRRMASLRSAVSQLLTRLKPEDRVSLISFSHRVRRLVPMGRDIEGVRDELSALEADGATGLRDAVYLSLQSSPHTGARPVVVVFSDGVDTASWLSEDEVVVAARRAGTVAHMLLMAPNAFAERVADASGGRVWKISDDGELPRVFGSVLDEMRARYLLSYAPTPIGASGWHQIKVRVKGRSADVNARPGYFR